MTLRNKIAIVTGAGGEGSGRAIALRFAERGAAVVAADIQKDGARATARQIETAGGRAIACQVDVRDEREVRAMIAQAEGTYGGLDVLVNNASAIPHGEDSLDGWAESIETDLLGAMYGTRLAIDALRRRGGGVIVNVGSTSALAHGRTTPGGFVGYDVAKVGIMRLTTRLAGLAATDGIRVNCIVPHWIAVPHVAQYWESLTPEERGARGVPPRLVSLEEIADGVEYLASEETLAGRLLVFREYGPRLIPWGDPGYAALETVEGIASRTEDAPIS